MSDLRKQLRKAGLVTDKQIRQARHRERIHASETGRDGLAAEKEAERERLRAEKEARRRADRRREDERKHAEREKAAAHRLEQVIRKGWVREATIGSRRFFFETSIGRISYLDLADTATRRLATGGAAIIETLGVVPGDFCVVSDSTAAEIKQLRPDLIRFWNRGA